MKIIVINWLLLGLMVVRKTPEIQDFIVVIETLNIQGFIVEIESGDPGLHNGDPGQHEPVMLS